MEQASKLDAESAYIDESRASQKKKDAWIAALRGFLRVNFSIGIFSALLIFTIWYVALDRANYEHEEAMADTARETTNLAIALEEHTVRTLREVEQILLFLEDQYRSHGDRLSIANTLKRLDLGRDILASAGIIDESGILVASTVDFPSEDFAEREQFKAAQVAAQSLYIGEPTVSRANGRWVIPIAHRIKKSDGSFGGIAFAGIDPQYFALFYQKANLGANGLVWLVGMDGIARASRIGTQSLIGQDLRQSVLLKHQQQQESGSYLSPGVTNGQKRVISYRTISKYGLIVAVGISEGTALAPALRNKQSYMGASVAGSLFVLIFAVATMYAIANRKRLFDALSDSERRFRHIYERLSNILSSVDTIILSVAPQTGDLLYANRAAVRALGRSTEEIRAKRTLWQAQIFPEDRARLLKRLEYPLDHKHWEDEFRVQRPDGQVRWIGSKGVCVTSPAGVIERIDIVASDITDQRKAEESRRQSEEKFKLLFNAANDVIDIHRPNGRFLEANVEAIRRWGYSREELLRMTPANILPSEIRSGVAARTAEIERRGTLLFETKSVTKDGSTLYGEVQATLIQYDGAPAILTITRDTTERNKAEETIRQAELRYRTLFEQAPVGIVIIDADNGEATECNKVAHEELGYSREEFLHLGVRDYEALEAKEQREARTRKILTQGADTFDTLHRTKDGELRNVHVVVRLLKIANRTFMYCMYQDITALKQSELALQRANRALKTLSHANAHLVNATNEQDFLSAVCHVLVEHGGYRLAAIGYINENDTGKKIVPMAFEGAGELFVTNYVATWADNESGQRAISKAIRSGKPEVMRSVLADEADGEWRDEATRLGYGSNLALPLFVGTRIIGALSIYASEVDAFDAEEMRLLGELTDDLGYGITMLRTKAERDRIAYAHEHHEEILRQSLEESIQAIADTVEMRDPYTAGHQRRVGALAVLIGEEMRLPQDKIHGIRLAASIHDLGKIKVPAEILAKPGKLSEIEYSLIKTHAEAGYDILKDISFPWPIATIVRQHHERMDGSGYPLGAKGNEILLESRIMAVADVVEAMASHRPYRPSLGAEATLSEIEKGRGTKYDPAVVDACLRVVRSGQFQIL